MAAHGTPTPISRFADGTASASLADASDAGFPGGTAEPVSPPEAAQWQALGLAASPQQVKMLVCGLAAVALGGTAGYWLAKRGDSQPTKQIRRTASNVENVAQLAPVALQLLRNPAVRALVFRLATRQISRRLGA